MSGSRGGDAIKKLGTDRSLAFLDVESTGVNPNEDRIVELAIIRVQPDGREDEFVLRINPGIPIPPESTEVHRITDDDVADAPLFGDVANDVLTILEGCDLAGFNLRRFDVPILEAEFRRFGFGFQIAGRRIVDAQVIFHEREPRNLEAAVSFYTGQNHSDAHAALSDTRAVVDVVAAQLARYDDLPQDIDALHTLCERGEPIEFHGWFKRRDDGELVFNRGKHRGTDLASVGSYDPGYLRWMAYSATDMPPAVVDVVESELHGGYRGGPPP